MNNLNKKIQGIIFDNLTSYQVWLLFVEDFFRRDK